MLEGQQGLRTLRRHHSCQIIGEASEKGVGGPQVCQIWPPRGSKFKMGMCTQVRVESMEVTRLEAMGLCVYILNFIFGVDIYMERHKHVVSV